MVVLAAAPELIKVKAAPRISEIEISDAVRSKLGDLGRCISFRKPLDKAATGEVTVTLNAVMPPDRSPLNSEPELSVNVVGETVEAACVKLQLRSLKLPDGMLDTLREAGRDPVTIVYRHLPSETEIANQRKENTASISTLCAAFSGSPATEHPKARYAKVRGKLSAHVASQFDPILAANVHVDAKLARVIFAEVFGDIAEELGGPVACKALGVAAR